VLIFATATLLFNVRTYAPQMNIAAEDAYDQQVISFLAAELDSHPGSYFLASDERSVIASLFDRALVPQEDIAGPSQQQGAFEYAALPDLIENGTLRYIVVEHGHEVPDDLLSYDLDEDSYNLLFEGRRNDVYEFVDSEQ
jgi:hypothetical protein